MYYILFEFAHVQMCRDRLKFNTIPRLETGPVPDFYKKQTRNIEMT